jgi:hypothetical protein
MILRSVQRKRRFAMVIGLCMMILLLLFLRDSIPPPPPETHPIILAAARKTFLKNMEQCKILVDNPAAPLNQTTFSFMKHWRETSNRLSLASAMAQWAARMNVRREDLYFVDVGAGKGAFALGVARQGFKVVAIDAMPANTREIRKF